MFYHGEGVAQSYDEAMRWYRLAVRALVGAKAKVLLFCTAEVAC